MPTLTGNAGFFTNVQAGQTEIVSEINPVLLVPFGERWLIESRGEFEGDFARKNGNGPFGGQVNKELAYLQADYIANPYVTVTVGRFLTPFGIYNERLYPIWIRSLQAEPLIFGMEESSSNGAMLRGGFPVNSKVNLNYSRLAFPGGSFSRKSARMPSASISRGSPIPCHSICAPNMRALVSAVATGLKAPIGLANFQSGTRSCAGQSSWGAPSNSSLARSKRTKQRNTACWT
ncbi:MAG: OprO/OprP family phosphate-selective porin [Acidobacteriia bacterium]|nr:OprO/OprP family phosphate-selective porin [Terriglobia bacterium]